jgi:putative transposase
MVSELHAELPATGDHAARARMGGRPHQCVSLGAALWPGVSETWPSLSQTTNRSYRTDETYIKVKGKDCYLYRAIDRNGNLVDSMLSTTRDMAAAQQFFRKTLSAAGQAPQQVTTDGHNSYPRAIREILGSDVEHRDNAYLNRRIEQDHRGIKQRYYPMLGFGAFPSAQPFCSAFDEVRHYFRPRRRRKQFVSLARQRQLFVAKAPSLEASFLAS